ncbi:MAG: hypothetical protein ACO3A2_02275 [Bdellovibrionia bacterium]
MAHLRGMNLAGLAMNELEGVERVDPISPVKTHGVLTVQVGRASAAKS